jgi:hypothetical protein
MKNNMSEIHYRTYSSEIRKRNEDTRTLTFVASDGARDAAGTVLNQENWSLKRYEKNPIIGYQHEVYGGWDGSDPDNIIGKARVYVEDGQLLADITFETKDINEKAEKIYKKLLFGSLNAVSVGFLPIGKGSWGKGEEAIDGSNPTYYYAGQELLEISVVNIPSNPNAVRRAMEYEQNELKALMEAEKPEPAPEPQVEDRSVENANKLKLLKAAATAALC